MACQSCSPSLPRPGAAARSAPASPPSGASGWKQVGYLKASNPGEGDQFGYAIALSGDGNTLAVGAEMEGSAAAGINGNQADNSADAAGAVYVFTRSGGRLVAAGLHQGLESRRERPVRGRRRPERRRQHAGRGRSLRGQRRHRDQRQPGRQLGAASPAPSMSSRARGHVVAAGLRQGLEHRASRTTATVRLRDRPERRRQHAGRGRHRAKTAAPPASTATRPTTRRTAPAPCTSSRAAAGLVAAGVRQVRESRGADGDLFGYAVGLSADGNTLAVGAFDEGGSREGD